MRYTLTSILFALGALSVASGQGQVSETVYQAGDTLYRAIDRLPSNPRLIHSNLQDYWDFTGLMAPYVQEIYVRSTDKDRVSKQDPTDVLFFNGDGIEYSVVVDRKDMWIRGLRVQQDKYFIDGVCEQFIPLRVGTDVVGSDSEYSGTIVFNLATDMVAALEDTELSLADSIRIVVDWDYQLTNDQKGQMQIESGLYDVVRQKLKKTVSTQTEIKRGGMWSVTRKPVPVNLPTELHSGTIFSFWSDELADPLAVVQTDELENAVSVSFRVQKQSGRRVVQSVPSQPDIYVHPNPSFGLVRFDLVNLPVGAYQLEIYNILGVRIRLYSLDVDGSISYPLNLSDLKKGTYIYRLVDSFQKTLRSKRLVIITP
jgi:Secretion system C-terminal sorting domain